ncbi:hypothetical protein Cni_G13167 [Canna indica]|uniref:Uncharacterized protein n=1 Tax=Canna indica TaxID=4628 RepID=A0AAQ3Q9M6_9LILI|nr:hypothetical protein Cni_G13167 [Canna indica]
MVDQDKNESGNPGHIHPGASALLSGGVFIEKESPTQNGYWTRRGSLSHSIPAVPYPEVHLLGFILKVANHMFSMIIYNNRSEVSFPLENLSNGTWDSTPPKGLGGLPGLCCVFVP